MKSSIGSEEWRKGIRKSGTPRKEWSPFILIEPDFRRCCFNQRFCGNTLRVRCSECRKYNIHSTTWLLIGVARGYSMRAPCWKFEAFFKSHQTSSKYHVWATKFIGCSERDWMKKFGPGPGQSGCSFKTILQEKTTSRPKQLLQTSF